MSKLPSTGDAALDFVIEAGPRALSAIPPSRRLAVAKTGTLGPYKEALRLLAAAEVEEMHREILRVSIENAATDWKASQAYIPYCRIPLSVIYKMQDLYGQDCWKDKDFTEDFLDHHPGLRVQVKRGIRGQEYAGRGR